jgi:hypothetical protein
LRAILSLGFGKARLIMNHKFKIGQGVVLAPSRYGSDRQTRFEVVRLLPSEHGINQYRLKSVLDGHERVAMENEVTGD